MACLIQGLRLVLLLLIGSLPAHADRIAIIGTGSVGGALGPEFAALGHEIVYGSREPDRDDVMALVERIESLGDLSGKIIIDPTNHIARDGDIPVLGTLPSNAEAIQAAAPGAKVVKAFNTLNYQQMVDPASSGGPVSIPLVGDDDEAKAKVAALVEGMGLEAIDLGPLSYAGHVEGMLLLWINARMAGRPFDYHLRRKPVP